MLYIFLALIAELGFMSVAILVKNLRNAGAETAAIMSISVFAIPFWAIVLGLILYKYGDITWSLSYITYVVIWVSMCYMSNFGKTFLFKFQGLSENSGLSFGLVSIIAMFSDYWLFGIDFSLLKIPFILSCITGGILLSYSRSIDKDKSRDEKTTMPTGKKLIAISFVAVTTILMLTVYKKGIEAQPHILFHIALTHILLFTACAFAGGKKLYISLQKNIIGKKIIAAIIITGTISAIAETFAIGALPIVYIILFSLIRTSVYAAYDVYNKEIKLTYLTSFSLLLVIISIIMLALGNYAA